MVMSSCAASTTVPRLVVPSPQLISAIKSSAVSAGLVSMKAATGVLLCASACSSGGSGGSGVSPRTAGSVSATSSVAGTLASSATCSRLTSRLDSKKNPAHSKNNDKGGAVTATCSASGDTTSALLAATAAAVPVVSLSVTAIGSAPATASVLGHSTEK